MRREPESPRHSACRDGCHADDERRESGTDAVAAPDDQHERNEHADGEHQSFHLCRGGTGGENAGENEGGRLSLGEPSRTARSR